MDRLNPDQLEAVKHNSSPLLILAGAGSGKTKALTHKAAYLISEEGIDPTRILLTTFTNKAASEMQERLEDLVGIRLPFAGTFHSLSARMLRKHGPEIGLSQQFVIYDTADQLTVLKQVGKELQLNEKEIRIRAVMAAIESAKHEMITPAQYAEYAKGPFQQAVARTYKRYQKVLRDSEALDFNDLLLYMILLLQNSKKTRDTYQEQFLYVLVDEYQDTNKAQYQITKLLSAKHKKLCVVGDASQAIYSWRGADYKNLMLLQQDFPDLRTIRLEQNYRSTQTILHAADGVISHNTLHPVLHLWSENDPGELVTVAEAQDEYQEAFFVVSEIRALVNSGTCTFDDIAVLYRTNAQSRVMEEQLIRNSIPYQLVGGVKFYERKEVKDVLAYLRYSYNPKDRVSYERMEKIGKRRLRSFEMWLEKADLSIEPLEILDQILEASTYLDKYNEKDVEDLARIENVNELRSVAQRFENLGDFLENVALVEQEEVQNVTNEADGSEGMVTLMTLHASKGLEFEHVFMIGMEEGLFPHSRSLMSKEDLEEERRLCYVGITRAKQRLWLTHAKSRVYFGTRSNNQVSRFVDEIPSKVVNKLNQSSGLSQKRRVASKLIDDESLEKFLADEIDIDEFLQS